MKNQIETDSFKAGVLQAKKGWNINNSYPFNHNEFVDGYKSVNPDAKTMYDECTTDSQRLDMLKIMRLTEIG